MYSRYRMVNPLLGVYYGIFTAAFIGLGVLLIILEYMGRIEGPILAALPLAAVFLGAGIAIASLTSVRDEYFISGRRVPAGLNGLVILVVSLGSAGLSGFVGAQFFWGIDAFGLLLGAFFGVIMSGVLFAAFVRKGGGYTLSTFFELRYQNRSVGVIMGLLLFLPAAAFAIAEFSILKTVLTGLLGVSLEFAVIMVFAAVLVFLLPGGVRSMSWSQCALAIVVVIGLLVPLILVALKYTNLPLAQFTYGSLIDDLAKFETLGTGAEPGSRMAVSMIFSSQPQNLSHGFMGGERPIDLFDKIAMFFVIATGVAAMPSLVVRAGVTSTAFQARKSYAWAAALIGFFILTVPAYVVFFRYLMFDPQAAIIPDALPSWVLTLQSMGLMAVEDNNGDGKLTGDELRLARDAVFIGLPMIAGFMKTFQSLTVAALLAAALAGLMARVMAISQYLIRDFHFRKGEMEADVGGERTLLWARGAVVLVMLVLTGLVYSYEFDPFQCFMAGILLCGLGIFPVLLVSIWSERMRGLPMLFLSISGFALAGFLLLITSFGQTHALLGLDLFGAGFAGLLVLMVLAVGFAQFSPKPDAAALERLHELRTPGGEAIYDRHLRLVMPRRASGR